MSTTEIICEVFPLSWSYQPSGLTAVELYVSTEFIPSVEQPKPNERIAITLSTSGGDFEGGLRNNENKWPYVCPDLRSKIDDSKTNLASVLKNNGFGPKDKLRVRVIDRKWIILGHA
jgi:hypothetical protein